MASKSKIRSMQRGAAKRDRNPSPTSREIYAKHPPKISSADRPHLDFIKYGRMERVSRIVMVIDAARRNGIGNAANIAAILNKTRTYTAIGERWTPRLAWFAVSALRQTGSKEPATRFPVASGSVEFEKRIERAVRSRLDEIQSEFKKAKPKLGDVSLELRKLKDAMK